MDILDGRARLLRLDAHELIARRPASAAVAAQIVRGRVAVQAQYTLAARLALRARCPDLAMVEIDAALRQERSLIRTWCLRGTLHLVAAEDLTWLLALLAPGLIRGGARRRAELGLDEATGRRGVRYLAELLRADGPLTRTEIAGRLATQDIPTAGQATIHLIGLAALEGVACYGPDREGEPTFVALDNWIEAGPTLPPEEAAVELARRYLAGYGPATPEDMATWSGLRLDQVRCAWQRLASHLLEVTIRGSSAWLLRQDAGRLEAPAPLPSVVRLVPGYDPYLLGYRSRDLVVDPPYARQIHPGGGVLHSTILLNGHAAGTWQSSRRRGRVEVDLRPFAPWGEWEPQIEAEVRDVIRFLEQHRSES